jgi:glutathionylspermidine synthase
VYPTEFTEDLSVIRLYRRWLEAIGFEVVLGSPYNLGAAEDGERATLFGRPVGAILRHYKTDGWGERASAWDDETLPDALPLAGPLGIALRASAFRKTAIINPFGAIVPQNKRTMAFMWEHIHRFSTRARGLIERHVPYTSRLETLHKERLLADREGWVLKSDYGAEGDEVVIGRETDDATWAASLQHARPGRWVAQRWFDAIPETRPGGAGQPLNYGVFLIAGEACGLYVRRQAGPTDDHAVSVPVLVRPA